MLLIVPDTMLFQFCHHTPIPLTNGVAPIGPKIISPKRLLQNNPNFCLNWIQCL